MLTLVTATSDRPEAFALCQKWIARQVDAPEYQWIVVDDGKKPAKCKMGQHHFAIPTEPDPLKSFKRNTLIGLDMAIAHGATRILFIEDDPWYSPDYLKVMDSRLGRESRQRSKLIVGEAHCRDYHVRARRFRICTNSSHASLCQTGIHADIAKVMMDILAKYPGADADRALWNCQSIGPQGRSLAAESRHCVNIKGMPGKTGLIGHDVNSYRFGSRDIDWKVLKEWIGPEDAKAYKPFRQEDAA